MSGRRSIWDLLEDLDRATDEFMEEVVEDLRSQLNMILSSQPAHVYGVYEACLAQEPAYTLSETQDEYRLIVDLPYVDPEKISLRLAGKTLTVEAPTKKEVNGRCVTFQAKIRLPKPVDRQHSVARFAGGFLVVKLKKQREVGIQVD